MAKELAVTLIIAFLIVGFVPNALGFIRNVGASLAYYAALLVVSIFLMNRYKKQASGASNTEK
jgi:type III secretory pathway component EscR